MKVYTVFLVQERFTEECQWSAHEEALLLSNNQHLQQAVYFLHRDLTFMKEVTLYIACKEETSVKLERQFSHFFIKITICLLLSGLQKQVVYH